MFSKQWQEILDSVDNFLQKSPGPVWYRGVYRKTYSLNSGLFRLTGLKLKGYLDLELQTYEYFRNLGHRLHGGEQGWNLLYTMQHYGVRTRLLNWTESFAAALFFALDGASVAYEPCIWMLVPEELNNESIGRREVLMPQTLSYPNDYLKSQEPPTKAIYPIKNTTRIAAQQGVFTVQGNSLVPLEQEFGGSLVSKGFLKQLQIPAEAQNDARRFLMANGTNHLSLFPDLEGLARHLDKTLVKDAWKS